ncbi:DUF4276 family protein [Catenuloplanes japonicus]|uniref:DUF4276 family protein n=1 Tax=Catenuloplanes japonicus TaxID=33876 RepID=UPI00052549AD|nr:DUF4276 family protein [Catenuloplanes japonicus]
MPFGGRLHLLVEGQTEEAVARNVIEPYLGMAGWHVTTSILATKRPAAGGKFRGGVTSWEKFEKEVRLLLASGFDVLTTLVDYYAFPESAPGMRDRPNGDAYARVSHVERALDAHFHDHRFIPHLVLHEMEAWVLAGAEHLDDLTDDPGIARDLRSIVAQAGGAELVNDGPATAPSKRILTRMPDYLKTLHGPLVIEETGLDTLRSRCPHLDEWLTAIESRLPTA